MFKIQGGSLFETKEEPCLKPSMKPPRKHIYNQQESML